MACRRSGGVARAERFARALRESLGNPPLRLSANVRTLAKISTLAVAGDYEGLLAATSALPQNQRAAVMSAFVFVYPRYVPVWAAEGERETPAPS